LKSKSEEYERKHPSTLAQRTTFNEIYAKYYTGIYGRLYKLSHQEELARDLTQETFLTAWKNVTSYDPTKGAITTWLSAIAFNKYLQYLRKKHVRFEIPSSGVYFFEQVGEETNLEQEEARHSLQDISKLLQEQTAQTQNVVELIAQGYSERSIARELGLNHHVVRKELERFKTKAKKEGKLPF